VDIWSKQKRSEVMSRIRGKNTKPEMILRSKLFQKGFRFRVHQRDLPGKPDIVLPKYQTAIFVHGCFWHYHKDCREGRIPSTNSKFWKEKLRRNIAKDKANIKELRKDNWNVFVIWECEIERHLDQTMRKLLLQLGNASSKLIN
jgi:DNA mismatch endonuclease, patch repair protein